MVLKRLLVTALSALGLGALVSGPAFSQAPGESNIPAPNIFDDQITCTQLLPTVEGFNLPSMVPMGGMTSPLDDIIGMGTNLLDPTDATITALANGAAQLAGLKYEIPTGNMNCGAGATGPMLGTMNIDADTNGSFLDAGDTLAWGSIPKDVADGYTRLRTRFEAVYGDPGGITGGTLRDLEAAQKLLDDTPAGSTALVEARTRARDAAQEEHNKRMATFNAASGGPIYQAAVTEWMALSAVSQSIEDYNDQVTKTNTALTDLDAMLYRNFSFSGMGTVSDPLTLTPGDSKYVPLTNTSLVGTVVTIAMGEGTVVPGELEAYTGGTAGMQVAGMAAVPAMGTTDAVASDSSTSNFTSLGELIVPMSPWDHDGDSATPQILRNTFTATNAAGTNDVATIRTTVMNVRIAAAALKKARDDNTNPRFQALYDEAYRRAMLEQNYYDAVWAQVLADSTDTRSAQDRLRYTDTNANGINEATEQTTANVNAGYQANPISIASRNAAYTTESSKRMTEEASLRGLVAAREAATAGVVSHFTNAQSFYQQLVDRRTALKAAADAAAPAGATELTAAQKAANTALTMAQAEKTKIDALFPADADNPVVDLVSELLKTGGDDGQALVDAISDTYDDAQDNTDRLDALLTTDADGTESGRIVDIEKKLGEGGNVDQLRTDLGALAGDGRTDETVKGNADEITGLDGRVADNEEDLDAVWMDTYGSPRGVDMQHDGLADCDATTGSLPIARCANARSLHNEAELEDVNDKLMDKAEYIGNLGEAIGVDPVTGEGTGEDGMSRIDMNYAIANRADGQSKANAAEIGMDDDGMSRIDHNEKRSMDNAEDIDAEMKARMAEDAKIRDEFAMADNEVRGEFAAEDAKIRGEFAMADNEVRGEFAAEDAKIRGEFAMADNEVRGEFAAEDAKIRGEFAMADNEVRGEFAAEDAKIRGEFAMADDTVRSEFAMADSRLSSQLTGMINSNTGMINENRSMIGALDTRLTNELETVRAGVAASMALAGMPAINGRGISIGVGSYDGESAFAVGFQIQGEQASFKVGVTSSGGETGASAGVGFNF